MRVRRVAVAVAIGVPFALLGAGCTSPAAEPVATWEEPSASRLPAGAEARLLQAFYHLGSGNSNLFLPFTDLASSRGEGEAEMLWSDAYKTATPGVKIVEFTEVVADDELGTVSVTFTYELERTSYQEEDLEVSLPQESSGDTLDLAIELASKDIGFDVSGARALPAGTTYAIHGVDVTGAFDAALAPGGSGRVPALGASYPVVVTVPGDVVGPRVFVLKPTSFYAAEPAGQLWSEFAAEVNAGIGG